MVNSPSVNGDAGSVARGKDNDNDNDNDSIARNTTTTTTAAPQYSSLQASSTHTVTPMTPLQLLQSFLKAQSTRSQISNELQIAFYESAITDAALQRVIEISSSGLLEVKNECQAVINLLSTRVNDTTTTMISASSQTNGLDDGDSVIIKRMISECKAIEALEKERIGEELKRLQLFRIGKLNDMAMEEQQQSVQEAQEEEESTAACIVEQRQKVASIKSALETSQKK